MSIKRESSRFTLSAVLSSAAAGLLALGCLETHSEPVVKSNRCTACHGDPNRPSHNKPEIQAAPPFDLNGNSQPSARGVGAHQAHLTESDTHVAVACTECHKVPEAVFEPGHMDNPLGATIVFGERATANRTLKPTYDYTTSACSNTYCHQALVPSNSPDWRAPKSSAEACGSCHGLPPPAPHPQSEQCFLCHGSVIDKDRHFVNKALHIDGKPDTGSLACNSCHGTGSYGAPPPDLEGNVATSAPGVGAHGIHLSDMATHAAVPCATCHVVPTDVNSPGHIDAARPADVTFGGLSTQGNSSPVYDSAGHTCTGSYCHGAATPVWNAPRTSAEACGSCHALPPPAPHPQKQDCSLCHSDVIDAKRKFVNASLHVNGKVEVSAACNSCHGSSSNNAPPVDLAGNTATTFPGVGAHQRHLLASGTHGPVACNECHIVPSAWNSPGHDVTATPPAIVTFGDNATAKGSLSPAYSSTSHTCTNTYCHASAVPNWVAQHSDSATCGTCHALPPPFVPNVNISAQSHPKVADCSRCHGEVIRNDGTFAAPSLHVDGKVQQAMTCNSCHGSATSFAPPTDLAGNTDVTSIGVGAHQAHVTGGKVGRPVPCAECHVYPQSIDAPGHIDDWGQAEVTFSGAAVYANRTPTWNRNSATCTDSWCHGPTAPGNVSPVWNVPAGTLGCISCHGTPPAAPHPPDPACNHCHFNIRADFTFIDITKHVNGAVDF